VFEKQAKSLKTFSPFTMFFFDLMSKKKNGKIVLNQRLYEIEPLKPKWQSPLLLMSMIPIECIGCLCSAGLLVLAAAAAGE
jgi:hypothetical protein